MHGDLPTRFHLLWICLAWQVHVSLHPGGRDTPLEFRVTTNNEALIVSVIATDPEGGLFGDEASQLMISFFLSCIVLGVDSVGISVCQTSPGLSSPAELKVICGLFIPTVLQMGES